LIFRKSSEPTLELIENFLERKDVQFFLQKAEIEKKEINLIEISKENIF